LIIVMVPSAALATYTVPRARSTAMSTGRDPTATIGAVEAHPRGRWALQVRVLIIATDAAPDVT